MKLDKQHFLTHYSSLTDSELVRVSERTELTAIAKECLQTELAKRGINDIAPLVQEHKELVEPLERQWKERQEAASRSVVFIARVRNSAFVMLVPFALYLMFFSGYENSVALALGLSGVAFLLILVVWAYIRVRIYMRLKVLDRPWWR